MNHCQSNMLMLQFTYRKGVYMLVSAVSRNSIQTVFSTRIKAQEKVAKSFLNETPDKPMEDNGSIFDSINEWKSFCHEQILQGKLDIIA